MGKPPAFQMYAADFFMDTNGWTVDQVGIYLRLLLTSWVNGSIPNDVNKLARIAGCSTQKFKKSWGLIEKKWTFFEPNNLKNLKLESVRDNQRKYSESRKKNINKRWENKDTHVDTHEDTHVKHMLYSSTSTSINKETNKPFTKSKRSKVALNDKKILADINHISGELYKAGWKEVHAFKNTIIKRKQNMGALLQCLTSCKAHNPKDRWAYCTRIMSVENGNHNEREHTKSHKEDKEDRSPLTTVLGEA